MADFTDEQKIELIELIEGFPELWNMKIKAYRDMRLKEKNVKWQIIATHFKTTVKSVKAIWKNLRTVFGREVPKCIPGHSGDSGDEGDDLYTGTWPFFHHLRFLMDTMKGRTMSGPLESSRKETEESRTLESQNPTEPSLASSALSNTLNSVRSIESQQTCDVEYMEEVIVHEDEEDFSTFGSTQKSSIMTSSSADSGVSAPSTKKKTAIQRALDLQERKLDMYVQKNSMNTNDEDMMFLKSLHPYMQKAKDKLSLRCEVMGTIKDFLRNEELLF